MFKKYEIYGTSTCFWCEEASKLLTEKGLPFKKLYLDEDEGLIAEFQELFPGKTSVPQILGWNLGKEDWESTHIGGYDELKVLLK